jgi:hypothetical protein
MAACAAIVRGVALGALLCLAGCPRVGAGKLRFLPDEFPDWTYEAALPGEPASSDRGFCAPLLRMRERLLPRYPLLSIYGVTSRDGHQTGMALVLPYECIDEDGQRIVSGCTADGPALREGARGFSWAAWVFRTDPRRARFRVAVLFVGEPSTVKRGPGMEWPEIARLPEGGASRACDGSEIDAAAVTRPEVRVFVYEYFRKCEGCGDPKLVRNTESRIPREKHLAALGLLPAP